MRNESRSGTLQAVERALRLLVSLAESPRAQTLQELSGIIECSPSTVHRMLATLNKFQLVEKDPQTRRYRLGLGVLYLAEARTQHLDLRSVARPYLEQLRDQSLETVSLYVSQGLQAVGIDRADSHQEVRRTVQIGKPIPLADLGATAKAFLAHLPSDQQKSIFARIRWDQAGVTREHLVQELASIRAGKPARSFCQRIPGASAMAQAILDQQGQVTAAVTISGPHTRWTDTEMDRCESALVEAARNISRQLGYPAAPLRAAAGTLVAETDVDPEEARSSPRGKRSATPRRATSPGDRDTSAKRSTG